MHPRILAARNQVAMESIANSARRIARALGREPGSIFDGTWVRDPECRALSEREAVERFMVSVAESLESGRPEAHTIKVDAEEALAAVRAEVELAVGATEADEEPSQNLELWAALPPVGRDALEAAGITSAAEVAGMSDEAILAVNGIGPKTLAGIRKLIPAFTQE